MSAHLAVETQKWISSTKVIWAILQRWDNIEVLRSASHHDFLKFSDHGDATTDQT